MAPEASCIRWFSELSAEDVPAVGGKSASLGELYCALRPRGLRVPNGFAITAEAYRETLEAAGALPRLRETLAGLDVHDVDDLARRARLAREIVTGAPLPVHVVREIRAALAQLSAECGTDMSVAVRSSATAEDLPTASFAGQHESFLNVSGEASVLDAVRLCFASLFKDRAIAYRVENGFDHSKVLQSVCVMQMVRSDRAASGVIFTLDTDSGFRDVVLITGAYGLGENVVQGTVDPDEFYVFKPTLKLGHRAVLRRKLGSKEMRLVYSKAAGRETTSNLPTAPEDQARYCIGDADVLALADAAVAIEDHYTRRAGRATPMDIEWAKDGVDGLIYIVQARPETVASQKPLNRVTEYRLHAPPPHLVAGRAVGSSIATGKARVISHVSALGQFSPGEVLVADTTMPDWGTVMKIAAAVVTNRGGRTCHAAIVARELGIPAVVGCANATAVICTGDEITVSCAGGAEGHVYSGTVPFEKTSVELSALARPQTHLMVNLGNPDSAFQIALLPNDGVGLARMEFIIAEHIRIHPMALLHLEKVDDPAVRAEITRLTHSFERPADYFVRELSEGVGMIAAAFYPKPVIVRMSDFKTNEYASLLGGSAFEPKEENPMIGFRGASRYTHPAYAEGFALECAAMTRVREEMGLVNVKLMIPFCRRIQEAERVLDAMAAHGLRRGDKGLEMYVMCEIPNNVIQIDAFARLFDGFSIGSNDLTQLVLGVDRDSRIVAFDFDERDDGVQAMIRQTIEGARRNGRHVGICGQAPSDYPDVAAKLVELGIDAMSVTPDTLLKITCDVLAVERRLGRPPRTQLGTQSKEPGRPVD